MNRQSWVSQFHRWTKLIKHFGIRRDGFTDLVSEGTDDVLLANELTEEELLALAVESKQNQESVDVNLKEIIGIFGKKPSEAECIYKCVHKKLWAERNQTKLTVLYEN